MTPGEWLGLGSVVVSFVGSAAYFQGILKGSIKPHAFTWLIWAIMAAIVFAAQYLEGAAAGAWATAAACVIQFVIAAVGFFQKERDITRSDSVALAGALLSIPLWVITKDPVWSVILLTVIDVIGYYPTFRKSWHDPYNESALSFAIWTLQWVLALMAMAHYNITTALYPAAIVIMNTAVVFTLLWRRKVLA